MGASEASWTQRDAAVESVVERDPAYWEVACRCLTAVRSWRLRSGTRVLHVGAGSGVISIPLAQELPGCTVIHLEGDPALCGAARDRAQEAGVRNLEFLACGLEAADFVEGSMGAVVVVQPPSALEGPPQGIGRLAELLTPYGTVFACDMTQRFRGSDWTRYVLEETFRRKGLLAAARTMAGRMKAAAGSRTNADWFRKLQEHPDLSVEEAFDCYCGCCDVVICRKSAR